MAIEMSEESRQRLEEMEKHSRFPSGVGRIDRGECPQGAGSPMACMFCPYGHMLECHYPLTCEEAECSHYQAELEAEGYPPDEPDTWEEFKREDRLLTVKRVDAIMQKYKGLPIHKGFAAGLNDCLIEQRELTASIVRAEILHFIEKYFVITVEPDGVQVYHIDDKEWQALKARVLKQGRGVK